MVQVRKLPLRAKWRRPSASCLAVVLVLLVGCAGVVLELCNASFRSWLVAHPLAAGLGAGLLLLVLTVLGVERALAAVESRRWERPARMALDTYIFSADRTNLRICEVIDEVAEPRPGDTAPPLGARLAHTAAVDTPKVRELVDVVRRLSDELAQTALIVATTLARHEGSRDELAQVFDQQHELAELSEAIYQLSAKAHFYQGQDDRGTVIKEQAEAVDTILASFNGRLIRMRTRYLGLSDALGARQGRRNRKRCSDGT